MEVSKIEIKFLEEEEVARRIMDGGDNYDGADGARKVLELCKLAKVMIVALKGAGIEKV